jgi:hypothetical protein
MCSELNASKKSKIDPGDDFYRIGQHRQLELLKEWAPKAEKPYIEDIWRIAANHLPITKENQVQYVRMISAFANRLAATTSPTPEPIGRTASPASVPEASIVVGEFLKAAAPKIAEIRRELWRSDLPLFPKNPKAAIAWLREEAKKERELSKQKVFLPSIPFTAEERVYIPSNGRLARLLDAYKLREGKPFYVDDVVRHILTGIRPTVLKHTFQRLQSASALWMRTTEVQLTVWAPVRKEEMNNLRLGINRGFEFRGMPGGRKKRLTEKSLRLYELVERLGGPPEKEKMEFWMTVMKAWNKRYPKEKYGAPSGLRFAYLRIFRRV